MDERPPEARREATVRRIHGDEDPDEYAWLRNRDDPSVVAHLEAENRYTDAVTAPTRALREALYREMLARIDETDSTAPVLSDGFRYYDRTEKGRQYPIHCRTRDVAGAPEEILLDENEVAHGFEYHRLGGFAVSPDQTLLAWSVDNSGGETFTVSVTDLASGSLLADRIEGAHYGLQWSADGRTLFYTVPDAAMRPHRLMAHTLGAAQSDDRLVLQEDDEAFHLSISRTRTRSHVLVGLESLTTTETRLIPADRPEEAPRTVVPRRHEVRYDVTHHRHPAGDRLFIRTNEGTGPNGAATSFRVVEAPAADPSPANWTEVLAHRDDVTVEQVEAFRDHLVVVERSNGLTQLRVEELSSGEVHHVEFPEPAYSLWLGGNREFDTSMLRLHYCSFVTPESAFDYDMATRRRTLVKRQAVHGYDPSAWVSERLRATAPDGTDVPVSLVRHRDAPRDGSRPLLLSGYGAYGMSRDASFSPHRLSLLERGFTYAIAHVRGGGDLGERWHDEGKTSLKPNTFTDFVACAEHLVAEGYTRPDRMALAGGSAGGLLVGAVLNLRPDLFAAAVAHVPFVDVVNTILDPSLPLSVIEYEEWGDPRTPGDYRTMRSYSPYDNVAARDYPPMLVTAGWNDPRVSYWEPAKWVARLRERKTDANRILLRTKMEAGHGGPSGRYESLEELAFEHAFLLTTLPGGDRGADSSWHNASDMPVLTDEARAALTSGHLAHLVTTNPDGTPQVSIVWIGLEEDEIVIASLGPRQKLRNVARDPRVALSLETGGTGPFGLAEYLVVYGTGRIVEGGGPELLGRLAEVYIGPGVKFPPMDDPPPGYLLRITPQRLAGVGPWAPLPAH